MAGETLSRAAATHSTVQIDAAEACPASIVLGSTDALARSTGSRRAFIILVDDNPADVLLVREALTWHKVKSDILVARDGDEAIRMLEEVDSHLLPCPDLMVLDLNLPRKTGFDVLQYMRAMPRCGETPVAILSSSDAPTDRQRAHRLGASRYFQKPSNLKEFMAIGGKLKEMLLPFDN